MTVFIDNAEFTARLQQENDELLAENLKLREEIARLHKLSSQPIETWDTEKLGKFFD